MLDWFDGIINELLATIAEHKRVNHIPYDGPTPGDKEMLSKIRALILTQQPRVVTREWVGETARMLVVEANQVHHDIFGCGMPQERYDILRKVYESYLSDRLREKGIEVKP